MKAVLLICAAGVGSRMRASVPKQYIEILGRPILKRTVERFAGLDFIERTAVVVSPTDPYIDELGLDELGVEVLRVGGETRAHSVNNGIRKLAESIGEDFWVLVHDAARPLVDPDCVEALVEAVEESGAAGGILAEKAVETLKMDDGSGSIMRTVDRSRIWRAQTPQLFRASDLIKAFTTCDPGRITDEASLMEGSGRRILLIEGNPQNIKITRPEDLQAAEQLLSRERSRVVRVGQGYDSHRLVEGRPLIIGGVEIPHEKGLDGHSDADVLLHAVTDALLGACGLGDIGEHFPPSDPKWKGADSAVLLEKIVELAQGKGWRIENLDATVVAEAPKFKPYKEAIRLRVAEILRIDPSCVSIKAKTNEGMDAVGRREGMMALAVMLVSKQS